MENQGTNDGPTVQARPLTVHEHLAVYDAAYSAGDFANARTHVQAALVAAPSLPDALWRFAQILAQNRDWDGAEGFAGRCVKYDPTNARAWGILSGVYSAKGETDRVIECAERALGLATNFPMALWNLSHALLRKGEYKRGFELYEWGTVMGQRRVRCTGRAWDGSPIPGKRLFVWNEQGYGDTLMFLRFVRQAKERSQATVYCDVQPLLFGLLEGQTGADECLAGSDYHAIGCEFDYHVSMASLPHILGVSCAADIRSEPYVRPVKWANVPDLPLGKTGLVWKGSPSHPNDANRSIPDGHVKGLEGKADWISLQHGAMEPPFPMLHIGHALSDFAFTASVLSHVERLVTVDTSMAHLAGAMGVPTILVVPLNGEWRWGEDGHRTPWYDSLTLVRPKDWDDAIDQVCGLLPEPLPVPKVARLDELHVNGEAKEAVAV